MFDQPIDLSRFQALPPALAGVPLIAVLFADRSPPLEAAAELAAAGWHGVMLDTANKDGGGLRDWTDRDWLADFVHRARAAGLLVGLRARCARTTCGRWRRSGRTTWAFEGLCAPRPIAKSAWILPECERFARLLDRASN